MAGVLSPNAKKIEVGSQFGTPELQFIEVAAVEDSSAVDFTKAVLAGTGAYTDADSLLFKAVNAIQGLAEVYIVGTPSATEFVVAINKNTANDFDSDNETQGYGKMEAAIDAAIGIGTGTHSVTVTELTITGDDFV